MNINYIRKKSDKEYLSLINGGIPFILLWVFLSLAYFYNDAIQEKGNGFIVAFFMIPLFINGIFIFRTQFYTNAFLNIQVEHVIIMSNRLFGSKEEFLHFSLKEVKSIKIKRIKSHFLSSKFYILYVTDDQDTYELWIMNHLFKPAKKRLILFLNNISFGLQEEVVKKIKHDISFLKTEKEYL